MAAVVRLADVEVGTELPVQSSTVTRADLVRYAGASGDFNVIHWNERVATEVARLQGLGATRIEERADLGVYWVVMQDPEGNEFCV